MSWSRRRGGTALPLVRPETFVPVDAEALDSTDRVVAGDVLGALTARTLGACVVGTSVSSNSMIAEMPVFDRVERIRMVRPSS